ncbi:tyrosine-type recombinase/integrase [Actinophytocola sp.]|uniref:tyrosine-type recombinase/integrase n=1 Tax=Actinophytocola sp. TaxID=1872138 RepID=UPI003D6C0DF6
MSRKDGQSETMAGSTFKRCGCRDAAGKQLGRRCARLRRNGKWNSDHGAWHLQLELPSRASGRRRTLRQGPFPSWREAANMLERLNELLAVPDPAEPDAVEQTVAVIHAALHTGTPLPDAAEVRRRLTAGVAVTNTPTVWEWLTEWLAGRRNLRANTRRLYEAHVRLYLHPHLGHLRLDRLRVAHLDAMFAAIEDRNTLIETSRASTDETVRASVKGQRTVSAATQQRIRGVLRKALNDAIRRSLITTNPACHVELASGKRPKPLVWTDERVKRWQQSGQVPSKVMVWTAEQTGRFLDHIREHRLYALYHLIAYRGPRRGEACGIHDDDINATQHELSLRSQRVQIGWNVEEGEPKTDAGERTVALDAETLRVLHAHQAVRDAEKALRGDAWVDQTGLLFTEPDGTPLHPAKVTDTFITLAAEAGLPPIRLHDLRHGAATLALAAGVDIKVVQDMLGHSSHAITADTYTSVLPQVAHHAAETTAALIPRSTPSSDLGRVGP